MFFIVRWFDMLQRCFMYCLCLSRPLSCFFICLCLIKFLMCVCCCVVALLCFVCDVVVLVRHESSCVVLFLFVRFIFMFNFCFAYPSMRRLVRDLNERVSEHNHALELEVEWLRDSIFDHCIMELRYTSISRWNQAIICKIKINLA